MRRNLKLVIWLLLWLISACASSPTLVPCTPAPSPQAPSNLMCSPEDLKLQLLENQLQELLDQLQMLELIETHSSPFSPPPNRP